MSILCQHTAIQMSRDVPRCPELSRKCLKLCLVYYARPDTDTDTDTDADADASRCRAPPASSSFFSGPDRIGANRLSRTYPLPAVWVAAVWRRGSVPSAAGRWRSVPSTAHRCPAPRPPRPAQRRRGASVRIIAHRCASVPSPAQSNVSGNRNPHRAPLRLAWVRPGCAPPCCAVARPLVASRCPAPARPASRRRAPPHAAAHRHPGVPDAPRGGVRYRGPALTTRAVFAIMGP